MGMYWLLDRHGSEGPSALVETDGSMRVTGVVRFGSAVTELEAQQQLLDDVIGKVAPTLKPIARTGEVDEQGIDPHEDLQHPDGSGNRKNGRTGKGGQTGSNKGAKRGSKRTGGRGRG